MNGKMKKLFGFKLVLQVIFACTMCFLTACEEHDGIDYFKSKCVAKLNGQSYIDQTPFTISPDVIVTPEFHCNENTVSLLSMLRTKRNGTINYVVRINLFADQPDALLKGEQFIEKIDGELSAWDYTKYCRDNKISYATVNEEVATRGSFQITSYDKERGRYKGTFTLHFSEGVLKGEFSRE